MRNIVVRSTFAGAVLALFCVVPPCEAQPGALSTSSLTGLVVDTLGAPVRYAHVLVVNGTAANTADSTGRFRLTGLSAGRHIFEVRRIGYDPVHFVVNFTDSVTIDVRVRMREVARELVAINVDDTRDPLKAVGFYKRMAEGYGHFLSPQMISEMRPIRATDAFAAIPNLVIDRRGNKSRVMTSNYRCEYGIVIDRIIVGQAGSRVHTTSPDDLVSASDLYAVEVYPRNRGLPARFLGMNHQDGCGTIVIWTKGMLPR